MSAFVSKCAECARTNQKDCHAVSRTIMDNHWARLRKEIRKTQEDAAAAAARVVRKQRELDFFMKHYDRKLKHDLDELEAEDNERERALAVGEVVDETLNEASAAAKYE